MAKTNSTKSNNIKKSATKIETKKADNSKLSKTDLMNELFPKAKKIDD